MYYERLLPFNKLFIKSFADNGILSLRSPTISSLPILLFKILAVMLLIMLVTSSFFLGSVMVIGQ